MSVSKRLRFEIFRRDHHACRYCGATASDTKLTIDHVVPTALGGTDEPSNLVTACKDCNAGKTSSVPNTWHLADVSTDGLQAAHLPEVSVHGTNRLANELLGHLDIKDDEQARQLANETRISREEDEGDEQPVLTTLEWAVLGAVGEVVDKAAAFGSAVRGLLLQLPAQTREELARDCAAELTVYLGDDWSEYDLLHWMVRRVRVTGVRDPAEERTGSNDDPWAVK